MFKSNIFQFFLAVFIMTGCQQQQPNLVIQKELKSGWTFSEVDGQNKGTAEVPGTIHTDLLSNGLIEDPFYRTNEKTLQWIDKKDWIYETSFEITDEELDRDNLVMDFYGLDTYADVYINDALVLEVDNMFRTWQVSLTDLVTAGKNTLKVYLHSPTKKGLKLLEQHYPLPASNDQSENGEMGDNKVSIFTRKAGYHYGWDWGPRLVTSGIWRPIVVRSWNSALIEDVYIEQQAVDQEIARLSAKVTIKTNRDFEGTVTISNRETGERYVTEEVDGINGFASLEFPFEIENPQLWWSAGLGAQNFYNFEIELLDKSENTVAEKSVRTGLRSIQLIREKDELGGTFYFEINGVPAFMKGANYIPNDSFLTRVTDEDYRKVVLDAVDANMNMLRVWGGGIYENDLFYELCDENGILVWQDFMFACSMYPGDQAFLESVRQEAIDNVVRLRNHPSIALWCGNNEINTAWHHYGEGGWGWKEKYTPEQREEIHQAYLDIFHKVLPEVVEEYTYNDGYWPSSPQAGYEAHEHANYESTSGDLHYWGVWHGKHPFEDFEKYRSRFMSEYGFQSFPDFNSVKTYTIPEDYSIESEVMAAHQRSGIGNLRIREYMEQEYRIPEDFADFLYMSQVLQAKGIKMAIEAHRRAMPYCMGSLYWQINDCWPVASWSSTDYYHKWKAMHYEVKKANEPVLLTISKTKDSIAVHGVSDLLDDREGVLKLTMLSFNGEDRLNMSRQITLNSNTSTLLEKLTLQSLLEGQTTKEVVLLAEFFVDEQLIASNHYYFERVKDLNLENTDVEMNLTEKDGSFQLELSAPILVKNLYLDLGDSKAQLSDNYFDLLPNRSKTILIKGEIPELETIQLKHVRLTYN